jgi:hypothetical protein
MIRFPALHSIAAADAPESAMTEPFIATSLAASVDAELAALHRRPTDHEILGPIRTSSYERGEREAAQNQCFL